MKLVRGITQLADFSNGVVATIGNFDGVHLGHQNLIKTLRKKADDLNLPLVLILFEPQPKEYFQREHSPARLSSLREKLDVLKQCNIDYIYCIRFNTLLAETTAADFAREYLFTRLNVKYLLVGADFRFGKDREGTVNLLRTIGQDYSCDVSVYSDFCVEDERVSSTTIRLALQQNNLDLATKYLGRIYSLCGRVIQGDGRGRQWGIPTANLGMHRWTLPLAGVYVVQVKIASQIVFGVANIGKRPTVDGTQNILEVHLLNFNTSIYGELVHVFFLYKLRDEVKFTSVDALISQIHQDIKAAQEVLRIKNIEVI